ncbi:hypothetical protein BGZ60DRAFT_166324 [Tricladium varicosporioides]|nr:hypothetical protein BGZ60DRAFT_166324 [Hymenoscyphus varicosporioides]
MEAREITRLSETPTPVNRACGNCARAKAKCIFASDAGGKCQRCYRLQKTCEPTASRVRATPRARKLGDSNRITKTSVAKLEEKLDGLVTLLQSSREPVEVPQPPIETAAHVCRIEATPLSIRPICSSNEIEPSLVNINAYRLLEGRNIPPTLTNSHAPNIDSQSRPYKKATLECLGFTSQKADALLDIFRTEMTPNFSFAVVDKSLTAIELLQENPLLFIAIAAIASRETIQQKDLGNTFIVQMSEAVFVRGERSMEILVAIITYAGWSYYHFYNVPRLTGLISAACTILYDLKLTRPPTKTPLSLFDKAMRHANMKEISEPIRTIDERRAYLGCYFLTCIVSSCFHRIDALPYTSYVDQCCSILEAADTRNEDHTLIALVRLQLVSERIKQAPWNTGGNGGENFCPQILHVKALETQLRNVKAELAPGTFNNVHVNLSYHAIEVLLYKCGLFKSSSTSSSDISGFDRLEILHKCLQSVKSFMDVFFAIPASQFHTLPIAILGHLMHVLVVLQILSCFESSDWDLEYSRQEVSLTTVLKNLADKFENVTKELAIDAGSTIKGQDVFSISAVKMRCVEEYCRSKMAGLEPEIAPEAIINNDYYGLGDNSTGLFSDTFDDTWMCDILAPLE